MTSTNFLGFLYLYLPPVLFITQTPSPTPPPEKKTPLSGVASALKGVEFIAQHIRKADKDTEVSEGGTNGFGFGGLSFKTNSTGISSQIRTELRDWGVWQARAGCYSQAACPQMTQRRSTCVLAFSRKYLPL